MQILRIVSVQVNDNSNIDIKFTDKLVNNLSSANISILADTPNVPSSSVLTLTVNNDIISIVCQPLTPLASYFIELKSTASQPFISIHGTAKISEDGVSNRYLIIGPMAPNNAVKNFLTSYLRDNIYNLDDSNTLVSKYINSLSQTLSKALYDIGQVKNENYLSFTITDENKIRGEGPFDRLNEESAYQILRVGRGSTQANANMIFNFETFSSSALTLQKQSYTEVLTIDSINMAGKFNINGLILNLTKSPVTKVSSIVFTLSTSSPIYTYDINSLGYQIKNSRYDKEFGFDYLLLEDNQIKLNDIILEDINFVLDKIIRIDVQYEYKDLGRVINTDSISVFSILQSVRETLPPIINVFNLKKAPIVDGNGDTITLGGITFLNTNVSDGSKHPAFVTEIPFRLNSLPFIPGQYSVDYETGTVYVFGEDLLNDGTGPTPPLATYSYKHTYHSEQDYVYDSDSIELVALPNGNLLDSNAFITFNYEEVLIPGTDYKISLHQEALTERIGNNLVALNVLKTKNSPVTNVFRILNETSGEIYTIDRWNDNKIYFRYNNPPRLTTQIAERANFITALNELLFVDTTIINNNSLRIFKILLNNNELVSATEDSIGSFINTSVFFSHTNIFVKEKWFNNYDNENNNLNRLQEVGEYNIDYNNGIIYCAVSSIQDFNLGTSSYKYNSISLLHPNIISVEDIYYQISSLIPKNKTFTYIESSQGEVVPVSLDPSDELFLNNVTSAPYQISNGNIGVFAPSFISGVTSQIKFIRGIFEYEDFSNNTKPLNFANVSTSSGFNISTNSISNQVYDQVKFDDTNFYITIDQPTFYLSSNITYDITVTRISDGLSLWDNTGTIVPGDSIKLILPGINFPIVGDMVNISYTFTIDNLSRVVVDYNKGEYFIDYTYVADELIVSYEYGDNVLDFRQSLNMPTGTSYFVSYKVGALRDALLKNFGNLVNVPELSNFDIDFDRERYRDALTAALTSFIQGPTITAMKNIGKTISHVEPEINESVFQEWSLGNSLLAQEDIIVNGGVSFLPAKFGDGILINGSAQNVNFPFSSNIRLEEGTFETWIIPQWNGLDNDADITFNILKDGYAVDASSIFIGAAEYHPDSNIFTLNKKLNVIGKPNTNKDGIFIYYDADISGNFNRWFVEFIDGYVENNISQYKFKITSSGLLYDVKNLVLPKSSNVNLFTGTNSVSFTISPTGQGTHEGISLISDTDHYILDAGLQKTKNRLSLFKDVSGYFNFRVYDQNGLPYIVSSDVSSWKVGELHHVACSWKLNTYNNRDEIHLFIDGFEVPNIIRYGQKLKPYLHEKFRTVNPEEIIGLVDQDIISSIDLVTIQNGSSVTSSLNFSAYNISPGDTIYIDELGFSENGYIINSISGQSLILNDIMPISLSAGKFSVNRTQFIVDSEIDLASNISVTTMSYILSDNDITGASNSNIITSSNHDFEVENIKIGYTIRIDNTLLETIYTILDVNSNTITINENLPINIINDTYRIYNNIENEIAGIRALHPSYSISQDVDFNNILTVSNNVSAGNLILVRTLGLNHKKIKTTYYVWSNNTENVLMTKLPAPTSLDEVKITKIILPTTLIGPNNSSLIAGSFVSNNILTNQPSNDGRTLSIILGGSNSDFTTPAQITINGISNFITINETIVFNDYGVVDSINKFSSINYIIVEVTPINSSRIACNVSIKEKYSITQNELNQEIPIIRYSYQVFSGNTLYKANDNSVRDNENIFSRDTIGNYLVISSPSSVSGYYQIMDISEDLKSITVAPVGSTPALPLATFTNGIYQILNSTTYRSGLQNGFFTLEKMSSPGQPYYLNSGLYEFDYQTYARIKLDPINSLCYLGSDFENFNQINAILDQVKIYSTMLTDTRVGESIPATQRSITKDFNSLKALKKDALTLMLLDFNNLPLINTSDFYVSSTENKKHFHSSVVINDNFTNSLALLDNPIIIPNDGILNTKKEATIEFWINPLFDTANDPNTRFYFDAYGAVIEEMISTNSTTIQLNNPANRILSVKLTHGNSHIDYFAGGTLEIDTQRAIIEEHTSINNATVNTNKSILQIISVKIIGDLTNTDYFDGGSIGVDGKTIYLNKILPYNNVPIIITYQTTENNNEVLNTQVIRLNKKLPYHKSKVTVTYLPKGLHGDRIAIFKNTVGDLNFGISASNIDYVIKTPIYWSQNTWHRIKASYKINSQNSSSDEMKLFIDGYQYSDVIKGNNLISNVSANISETISQSDGYTLNSIIFNDPINTLFIGTQYDNRYPTFSLIDNLRISNISRSIYAPYGEPIDINYNSNLDVVFPVVSDLYTTYLLDFNLSSIINKDFALLKNRNTGLFDFSINILDSFGIVSSNVKVKETLEKLIKILKPANSKVFIQYTT